MLTSNHTIKQRVVYRWGIRVNDTVKNSFVIFRYCVLKCRLSIIIFLKWEKDNLNSRNNSYKFVSYIKNNFFSFFKIFTIYLKLPFWILIFNVLETFFDITWIENPHNLFSMIIYSKKRSILWKLHDNISNSFELYFFFDIKNLRFTRMHQSQNNVFSTVFVNIFEFDWMVSSIKHCVLYLKIWIFRNNVPRWTN